MKQISFLCMFLAGSLFFTGCDKDKDDPKPATGDLAVDVTSLDLPATIQKKTITVTGADKWEASVNLTDQSDVNWCRASKSGNTLTVRLDENFKKAVRRATITVKAGDKSIDIPVSQAAAAVERDPFWSEFSEKPWNDAWNMYTFNPYTYDDGAQKFDITYCSVQGWPWGSVKTAAVGKKMTVGIKLGADVLTEFSGKHVYRLEIRTNGPADVNFAVLKKKSVSANDGTLPEYIAESYKTTELWRSSVVPQLEGSEWAIIDSKGDTPNSNLNFELNPNDGEIFLVAYINNTGTATDGFLNYAQQIPSKWFPTYVSFTGVDGQNLYHFIGGNLMFNFYID